jgi:importin subunit alpha-2
VASIYCGNTQKEFAAAQAVRKMLSREKNPPIDTVIGLNLIPKLIVYLENFDDTGL